MDDILVYMGYLEAAIEAMNDEMQNVGASGVFDAQYEQAKANLRIIKEMVEDAFDESEV